MAVAVEDDAAVLTPDAGLAMLTIDPTSYDYGSVPVQTISAIVDYTITNAGATESGNLTTMLSSSEFYVLSDSCAGNALGPQATCVVTVKLYPSTAGTKNATLIVSGSPGGSAVATLIGVGTTPAQLDIKPVSYDFGSWAPGTTSSNATFTVTNVGGSPTAAPTVTVTGADLGAFAIIANVCTKTMGPGDTCQVLMAFLAPTTIGLRKAQLELYANPGNNLIVPLAGNVSYVDVTPKTKDLGATTFGGANTLTADFSVAYTGKTSDPAVTVNSTIGGMDYLDFAVTKSSCTNGLRAGDPPCTITVAFRPGATGTKSASLNVVATDSTGGGSLGTDHAALSATAN
jgi:hypothetical protein